MKAYLLILLLFTFKAASAPWIDSVCGIQNPHDSYNILPFGTGQIIDGDFSKWSEAQARDLTYCVSRHFGSQTSKVSRTFGVAADDWMNYANVQFSEKHVDNCEASSEVLFKIIPVGRRTRYSMRAFFPHYDPEDYLLRVNTGKLRRPDSHVIGVFRHEIGHILGLRHEQAHPDATVDRDLCPMEQEPSEAITEYDLMSVMHYGLCGGKNGHYQFLSELDKQSIAILYPF